MHSMQGKSMENFIANTTIIPFEPGNVCRCIPGIHPIFNNGREGNVVFHVTPNPFLLRLN